MAACFTRLVLRNQYFDKPDVNKKSGLARSLTVKNVLYTVEFMHIAGPLNLFAPAKYKKL